MSAVSSQLICKTFPVGLLHCNCTLIGNTETGEALVIDPGGDADQIMAYVYQFNLRLVSILHTHAHLDHVMGAGALKQHTGARIAVPAADRFLWEAVEMQCRAFRLAYTPVPEPDDWLQDGDALALGGIALHTPGHSPGSTCFWFPQEHLLVAGDTLFRRGIGRTDLWGGDYATLEQSIRQKLYRLDQNTRVITGHGPDTLLGDEMRENPYIRG